MIQTPFAAESSRTPTPRSRPALVADIGGSKTRLALAYRDERRIALERIVTIATPVDPIGRSIRAYWNDAGRPELTLVAAGAAGRVHGSGARASVKLTNRPLAITADELAQACDAPAGVLMGDLGAAAHALRLLESRDLVAVGAPEAPGEGARLVIGVGTGFGAAVLSREGAVLETEAGHMDLATVAADEHRWRDQLAPQSRLSVEHVLSGAGMLRLAEVVAGQRHASCDLLFAAARAQEPAARAAIVAFSRWLGRSASNLVLATGAWGGVYLVGGVVQGLAELLDVAAFRDGFEDKAPFTHDLAAVPVFRITAAEPALLGLGAFALALDETRVRRLRPA